MSDVFPQQKAEGQLYRSVSQSKSYKGRSFRRSFFFSTTTINIHVCPESRYCHLHPVRPHRKVYVLVVCPVIQACSSLSLVAEAVKAGVESAGGKPEIFQYVSDCLSIALPHHWSPRIPETLSAEVLAKLHAPEKPAYPVITPEILQTYDAFLFGIPTRYGNFPGQWKVCSSRLRIAPSAVIQSR